MADTVCTRTFAQTPTTSPAACNGCSDNFPLPQAVDFFDQRVVQGYVERRSACDRCPASQKPCLQQADTAPTTSTSLIVLSLRPDGAKFNGNRIERAQEAGFAWLKDDAAFIGYASADTGREIARFVTNKSHEAFGTLREIQVHIDPDVCEWQWNAGTAFMSKLQRYAVLIGAYLCDGMGQRMDESALNSIASHIDAVMDKRRTAAQRARTVTLPSGEQRELSELSFSYGVVREAGSKKKTWRSVHFEAPALHYYEGQALGMQMAGEVAQFYRRHKTDKLRLNAILCEALELCKGGYGNYDKATQSNVAAGFIDAITTMIEIGARQLNPKWIESQVTQNNGHHAARCQQRDERKAAFAERMRQARAAKRATREVDHGI